MKGKVLITGGAGFIGSHTADLLIKNNYKVVLYDNLNIKTHNGKWPKYVNPEAELIFGNITDEEHLKNALKGIAYIIHLAAEMDLNPDFKNFMDINVGGTALIYELIVKNNFPIKKIVIASSQFVYGEGQWSCDKHGKFSGILRDLTKMKNSQWNQRCPICNSEAVYCHNDEKYNNPPNHYALSKLFQEEIAIQLGKLYNIPSTPLRYSIVHGPRQSLKNTYSGALRNFAIRIDMDLSIPTFEDNLSKRDFVSVYDVAEANKLMLEKDNSNFQVYNVGGGESWKIKDLALEISKIMNKPFSFKQETEFRVGDIRHAISDISKIQKLGWKPKFSEQETLKEYISWFKKQSYDKQVYLNTQKEIRNQKFIQSINIK